MLIYIQDGSGETERHGALLERVAHLIKNDAPAAAPLPETKACPAILDDEISVMSAAGVTRMHTSDLLANLARRNPETYAAWDSDRLGAELIDAGVHRRSKQLKINGINRNGWLAADLLAARSNTRGSTS